MLGATVWGLSCLAGSPVVGDVVFVDPVQVDVGVGVPVAWEAAGPLLVITVGNIDLEVSIGQPWLNRSQGRSVFFDQDSANQVFIDFEEAANEAVVVAS